MNRTGKPISLEALAADAQRGDQRAFRDIVELTQELAFSVSFRFLTNQEEARESAHESYIRLWNGIAQYDTQKKFTTWFYRIIANTALDRLRRRSRWQQLFRRTEELTDELIDPEDVSVAAANRELGERIRRLTEQLPLKQKAVFILRDLQELTNEETAEVLGMSPENVKANLHHARTGIRKLLLQEIGT